MVSSNEHDRDDGGFLSRWSRRKQQVRQGAAVAEPPVPTPPAGAAPVVAPRVPPAEPAIRPAIATQQPGMPALAAPVQADTATAVTEPPAAAPPPPTLADVAALTAESDYARFVAPGVDRSVKNAALKKLFTDPHFNIMDGLDTYIDDYGQPDPLPEGMLRQMAQSHALGLFADDPPAPPAPPDDAEPLTRALRADTPPAALPPTSPQPNATPDEDAALRLQPHDAAGPAGPGPGAGPHAGRQL